MDAINLTLSTTDTPATPAVSGNETLKAAIDEAINGLEEATGYLLWSAERLRNVGKTL